MVAADRLVPAGADLVLAIAGIAHNATPASTAPNVSVAIATIPRRCCLCILFLTTCRGESTCPCGQRPTAGIPDRPDAAVPGQLDPSGSAMAVAAPMTSAQESFTESILARSRQLRTPTADGNVYAALLRSFVPRYARRRRRSRIWLGSVPLRGAGTTRSRDLLSTVEIPLWSIHHPCPRTGGKALRHAEAGRTDGQLGSAADRRLHGHAVAQGFERMRRSRASMMVGQTSMS